MRTNEKNDGRRPEDDENDKSPGELAEEEGGGGGGGRLEAAVDVLLSSTTARLGTTRTAWMNDGRARNKGVVSRDNWKLRLS